MKNPWIIIGIITVVLFGGAIWFSSMSAEKNNEGIELTTYVKGNPEADTTLVEYSDLQCPACASFYPVVKDLLDQYGDQIRFEYKHFPLPMHQYAMQAAMAAEAAGQQGKFFEFHDILFERQQEWGGSATPNTFFLAYAEELELDIDQFRRHQNSSVLRDHVRDQMSEARTLGVGSTPSFFLNGEYLNPEEFQTFQGFIEQVAAVVDPSAATSTNTSVDTGTDVRFGL